VHAVGTICEPFVCLAHAAYHQQSCGIEETRSISWLDVIKYHSRPSYYSGYGKQTTVIYAFQWWLIYRPRLMTVIDWLFWWKAFCTVWIVHTINVYFAFFSVLFFVCRLLILIRICSLIIYVYVTKRKESRRCDSRMCAQTTHVELPPPKLSCRGSQT